MEIPAHIDDAEAALGSGDRQRISRLLERFFPFGAVLCYAPTATQIAVAGAAPGGQSHAIGLAVHGTQLLGQQAGCSVMFMQGLDLKDQAPNGIVAAKEMPSLPDMNTLRRLRGHG